MGASCRRTPPQPQNPNHQHQQYPNRPPRPGSTTPARLVAIVLLLHRNTLAKAQGLPFRTGVGVGIKGIPLGDDIVFDAALQDAGEILAAQQRFRAVGTTPATAVVPALLAFAIRGTRNTCVGISADLAKAALPAKPVATIVAAFLAQAVGDADLLALAQTVTGLAKSAVAAGAAATIRAALLARAVGGATRNAVPLIVAGLSPRTHAAGTTAAIITALLARTIGSTRRRTVPLSVADFTARAGATRPTTAVRPALLACAIGRTLGGAVAIGVAEGIHRTGATTPAASIRPALLAATGWSTRLLAVTVLAEEGIGALPAAPAAAIIAAGLARAVGLTDILLALPRMALVPRLTASATAAAPVIAANQAVTLGLAAPSIHALAVLAALARRTRTARAAAAVATAGLAIAIRHANAALTAVKRHHIGNALIIPLCRTTEGIVSADALLDRRIVAAGVLVGRATIAQSRASTAVTGADLAGLTTVAFAVAADRVSAAARTTSKRSHLVHADAIPLHLAAEGILVANAGGNTRIIAGWRAMSVTTSGPRTGAAVSRADETVLVNIAVAITAATAYAVTTVEGRDLFDTDLVPGVLAAE